MFRTKKDADDWLADKQTEMRRGDWHDPDAGKVAFGPYAATWIKERELTSTTRQLSYSVLKHHPEPVLDAVNLAEISPPPVRSWRAVKLAAGTGPTTVAKSYALLRAVLGTAVSDELIRRNPCQVKGAGSVHTPERPTDQGAEECRGQKDRLDSGRDPPGPPRTAEAARRGRRRRARLHRGQGGDRAGTTSTGRGTRRVARLGSRGCTSMIFGTRAARWQRQRVPARGS
ncbi:hypothetical protein [Streptomyces sp. H27-S2]|uniref:hypothetical protein n=1 Tax=Streptomyces antarcticus TaxID=2996458 RepID=UPI00226E5090|nr:hypothetical protein [Streptomyces sp. H27-S2]MCY0948856.1 hypothetical protein [Streptomyces sp. H27-S2]